MVAAGLKADRRGRARRPQRGDELGRRAPLHRPLRVRAEVDREAGGYLRLGCHRVALALPAAAAPLRHALLAAERGGQRLSLATNRQPSHAEWGCTIDSEGMAAAPGGPQLRGEDALRLCGRAPRPKHVRHSLPTLQRPILRLSAARSSSMAAAFFFSRSTIHALLLSACACCDVRAAACATRAASSARSLARRAFSACSVRARVPSASCS